MKMEMMQSKVEKFIEEKSLLEKKSKVILGVSGGADSIALLNILYKAGHQVIVAHCNFHLREEESMRDESFVQNISEERGLIYQSVDFDTIKHAAKHSISIEMAARELRYNWFEELRQKYNADAIAVAHHKDDSVETVLMNLIRGTGIRGLTGIEPKVGYIIRPFLCVTRQEVEDYIKDTGLGHVDDSTNNESIYTRNIIRLDVMPFLERINPSAKDSIYRSMQNLKQVGNIYYDYIEKAKKEVIEGNKINIEKLKNTVEPKAVLFEIISTYGFNSSTANDIYDSLDGQSGKIFNSDVCKIIKDREYLLIDKKTSEVKKKYLIKANTNEITTPLKLEIKKLKKEDAFVLQKRSDILYADMDKVIFPLKIRKWEDGDFFQPLGMKGKKKVSDFFTDKKFSLIDKEKTWILCSANNDIIWIIGHRPDERSKISNTTSNILKIRLLE